MIRLTGTFGGAMIRAVREGNPRCAGGRTGPQKGHSVNQVKNPPLIVLIVPALMIPTSATRMIRFIPVLGLSAGRDVFTTNGDAWTHLPHAVGEFTRLGGAVNTGYCFGMATGCSAPVVMLLALSSDSS